MSVCVHDGTAQIAGDACNFSYMATGLHCTVSAFHAADSTLTDVIPAAKKTVNINRQLLFVIQVTEDHCQLHQRQHRTMLHAANTCLSDCVCKCNYQSNKLY